MYLINVHLTGVHLIGVYLIGTHLIDVYFMDVYIFQNPPPYKRWSICRDLSCKIRVFALRDKRSLSAAVAAADNRSLRDVR
jgi:hypothetical protein